MLEVMIKLSALVLAAALCGCAHNPYSLTAPPMPAYIAGLSAHDRPVALTGYRLGEADTVNAMYNNIRNSGRSMPDTGRTSQSAPEVSKEIVNLPVPEYHDADGTVIRAHLERIEVVK